MAVDDSQERTEEATPKRQQEAREKGQIPRSRELNASAILLAGAGGLLVLGGHLLTGLENIVRSGLALDRDTLLNSQAMGALLLHSTHETVLFLAPFLLLMLFAGVVGPLLMGGWAFKSTVLEFKWNRLDPLQGLKRIFGWQGLAELLKALAKFLLIATAAVLLLWKFEMEILSLGSAPVKQALAHALHITGWTLLMLSAVTILIALVDVPFQIWQFGKQLRMTKQEVKQEYRETEGSPEMRGRIRTLQREMARRRMMADVPKADVIITNPTHYAVALRYNSAKMRAPIVVAKGTDLIAARIRTVAEIHQVTIISAPPLARALYFSTELNEPIPSGLYIAVARILAYVFQLKKSGSHAVKPPPIDDLPIPDEFRRE